MYKTFTRKTIFIGKADFGEKPISGKRIFSIVTHLVNWHLLQIVIGNCPQSPKWSVGPRENRFWRALVFGAEHFTAFWLVQQNSKSLFQKWYFWEGVASNLCATPTQPSSQEKLCTTPSSQWGLLANPCNPPLRRWICKTIFYLEI